jgi:arginyl-tRNA synthetase
MENKVIEILEKIIKEKYSIIVKDLKLNVPPKNMFWDYSFNGWILSRDLKKNPNIICSELKEFLEEKNDRKLIKDIEIAGSYLNIKLCESIYTDIFLDLYKKKENLIGKPWKDKTIVVDYIGVNVWKPLHIGHMCTPNIWWAMINIYKRLGYNVISDSHIWDWGIIFGKLITAYKLWGDESRLSKNAVDYLLELYIKITSEIENDNTLEEKIKNEFKLLSEWTQESVDLWSKFTKYSISKMNENLERLNVKPDYNIWESFYEWLWLPKMENYPDLAFNMGEIVNELIDKKIATKNDDSSVWVVFGDEKFPSCILQKRDWTHGYLASDLACIKYRILNWNPEKIIYFVDVRQKLHFEQAFEISTNAWWSNNTELIHSYNWFISWKDWAFSTRKWNIIKLNMLLDEAESRARGIILEKRDDLDETELINISKIVWIWAIKYWHLKKSRESDTIFDWDEFMSFEGNSGPYIQYAYVRSRRILEKFNWNIDIKNSWTFDLKQEIDLIKKIAEYNSIVLETTKNNMPHILCKYCYELTKVFNSFYNSVHILNEENVDKKLIRLQLVSLFGNVVKESFSLLSIDMPEKM